VGAGAPDGPFTVAVKVTLVPVLIAALDVDAVTVALYRFTVSVTELFDVL
jgi:hypothetical protein